MLSYVWWQPVCFLRRCGSGRNSFWVLRITRLCEVSDDQVVSWRPRFNFIRWCLLMWTAAELGMFYTWPQFSFRLCQSQQELATTTNPKSWRLASTQARRQSFGPRVFAKAPNLDLAKPLKCPTWGTPQPTKPTTNPNGPHVWLRLGDDSKRCRAWAFSPLSSCPNAFSNMPHMQTCHDYNRQRRCCLSNQVHKWWRPHKLKLSCQEKESQSKRWSCSKSDGCFLVCSQLFQATSMVVARTHIQGQD